MGKRAFYLAAYDIRDDKRRAKIAKIMESMGARVQGSVFEIWLDEPELELLQKRCIQVMKVETDSLRIYYLCQSCYQKVKIIGQGKQTEAPGLVIV